MDNKELEQATGLVWAMVALVLIVVLLISIAWSVVPARFVW